MSASALLKSRVRRPSYLKKLAKAEDLLHHFPNGAYIGWSGFTGVGYPKYVTQNIGALGRFLTLFPE
jgi:acetyl-CoA hydrolase